LGRYTYDLLDIIVTSSLQLRFVLLEENTNLLVSESQTFIWIILGGMNAELFMRPALYELLEKDEEYGQHAYMDSEGSDSGK